ncbi:MAG: transposase [Candidatus Binatia bacterium]
MTERRQKYTAEFKRDAVKLVTEQGYAIKDWRIPPSGEGP